MTVIHSHITHQFVLSKQKKVFQKLLEKIIREDLKRRVSEKIIKERLKSHARAEKVVHNFAWNPLCFVLGFLNPSQHGGAPHEKSSKYLILMLRPPQCLETFIMPFKNL